MFHWRSGRETTIISQPTINNAASLPKRTNKDAFGGRYPKHPPNVPRIMCHADHTQRLYPVSSNKHCALLAWVAAVGNKPVTLAMWMPFSTSWAWLNQPKWMLNKKLSLEAWLYLMKPFHYIAEERSIFVHAVQFSEHNICKTLPNSYLHLKSHTSDFTTQGSHLMGISIC